MLFLVPCCFCCLERKYSLPRYFEEIEVHHVRRSVILRLVEKPFDKSFWLHVCGVHVSDRIEPYSELLELYQNITCSVSLVYFHIKNHFR